MYRAKSIFILKSILAIAVCLNIGFWFYAKNISATWINVPPVPSKLSATLTTLGDEQFASRLIFTKLLNLGSEGGRITPIKNYDFEKLGRWFNLHYELDPKSDSAPYLAAFYYGASQDPSKIRPIIEYLRKAGTDTSGEKWRWLLQALYLARFKLKDLNLAMELANELTTLENSEMPQWTKHMSIHVLNQKGEKQAALEMTLAILQETANKIHPNEVNAMIAYMCEQILDHNEAKTHPVCIEFIERGK